MLIANNMTIPDKWSGVLILIQPTSRTAEEEKCKTKSKKIQSLPSSKSILNNLPSQESVCDRLKKINLWLALITGTLNASISILVDLISAELCYNHKFAPHNTYICTTQGTMQKWVAPGKSFCQKHLLKLAYNSISVKMPQPKHQQVPCMTLGYISLIIISISLFTNMNADPASTYAFLTLNW